MQPDEAKRVIASYLTGASVPLSHVDEALEAVRADSAYVANLRMLVGVDDGWMSLCRVFQEHVDTYCDLASNARRAQFPQLVAHVENCASCNALFWSVHAPWQVGGHSEGRAPRTLSEPVSVELTARRGCRACPATLPPVAYERLAQAADAGELETPEWRLRDESRGFDVTLRMRSAAAGAAIKLVQLTMEPWEVALNEVRVEIKKPESGRLFYRGSAAELLDDWIELAPGAWELTIEVRSDGVEKWTLPIEVHQSSL